MDPSEMFSLDSALYGHNGKVDCPQQINPSINESTWSSLLSDKETVGSDLSQQLGVEKQNCNTDKIDFQELLQQHEKEPKPESSTVKYCDNNTEDVKTDRTNDECSKKEREADLKTQKMEQDQKKDDVKATEEEKKEVDVNAEGKRKDQHVKHKERESVVFRVVREVSKEQIKKLKNLENEPEDQRKATLKIKPCKKVFQEVNSKLCQEEKDKVVIQNPPNKATTTGNVSGNTQSLFEEVKVGHSKSDPNSEFMLFDQFNLDHNKNEVGQLKSFDAIKQQHCYEQFQLPSSHYVATGVVPSKPDVLLSAEEFYSRKPSLHQDPYLNSDPMGDFVPFLEPYQKAIPPVSVFKEKPPDSKPFSSSSSSCNVKISGAPSPCLTSQAIPDLVPKSDICQVNAQMQNKPTDRIRSDDFMDYIQAEERMNRHSIIDHHGPFGDLNINPDERFISHDDYMVQFINESGDVGMATNNDHSQNILINNNGETSIFNGGNQIGYVNSDGHMMVLDKNNNANGGLNEHQYGNSSSVFVDGLNTNLIQDNMNNKSQVNMNYLQKDLIPGGLPLYPGYENDFPVSTWQNSFIDGGGGNYYGEGFPDFMAEFCNYGEPYEEDNYDGFTEYGAHVLEKQEQLFKDIGVIPNNVENNVAHSVVASSAGSVYHSVPGSGSGISHAQTMMGQNDTCYINKQFPTENQKLNGNVYPSQREINLPVPSFSSSAPFQNGVSIINPQVCAMAKKNLELKQTSQGLLPIHMLRQPISQATSNKWNLPSNQNMCSAMTNRVNTNYIQSNMLFPNTLTNVLIDNADKEHDYILSYQNKNKRGRCLQRSKNRYEDLIQSVKGKDRETLKASEEIENVRALRYLKTPHSMGYVIQHQNSTNPELIVSSQNFQTSNCTLIPPGLSPLLFQQSPMNPGQNPGLMMQPSGMACYESNENVQNSSTFFEPAEIQSITPIIRSNSCQFSEAMSDHNNNTSKPQKTENLNYLQETNQENNKEKSSVVHSESESKTNKQQKNSSAVIHISINNATNSSSDKPEKILNCSINIGEDEQADSNQREDTTNVPMCSENEQLAGILDTENINVNIPTIQDIENLNTNSVVPIVETRASEPITVFNHAQAANFSHFMTNEYRPLRTQSAVIQVPKRFQTSQDIRRLQSYEDIVSKEKERKCRRSKYDDLMLKMNTSQVISSLLQYDALHGTSEMHGQDEQEHEVDKERGADSDDEKHRFQDEEYVTSFIKSFQRNPRRYKVYPEAHKYKKVNKLPANNRAEKYKVLPRVSRNTGEILKCNTNETQNVEENAENPGSEEECPENTDLDNSFGDPVQLASNITQLSIQSTLENCDQDMVFEKPKQKHEHYVAPPQPRRSNKEKGGCDKSTDTQVKKLLAYINELNNEVRKMGRTTSEGNTVLNPDVKVKKSKYKYPGSRASYKHFPPRSRHLKPLDLSKKPKKRRRIVKRKNPSSGDTTSNTTTGSSSTTTSNIATPQTGEKKSSPDLKSINIISAEESASDKAANTVPSVDQNKPTESKKEASRFKVKECKNGKIMSPLSRNKIMKSPSLSMVDNDKKTSEGKENILCSDSSLRYNFQKRCKTVVERVEKMPDCRMKQKGRMAKDAEKATHYTNNKRQKRGSKRLLSSQESGSTSDSETQSSVYVTKKKPRKTKNFPVRNRKITTRSSKPENEKGRKLRSSHQKRTVVENVSKKEKQREHTHRSDSKRRKTSVSDKRTKENRKRVNGKETPTKKRRGRPSRPDKESTPNIPIICSEDIPLNLSTKKCKKFMTKGDESGEDTEEILTPQEFRRRFHSRIEEAASGNSSNMLNSLVIADDTGFTAEELSLMSQLAGDDNCLLILTCDNESDSHGIDETHEKEQFECQESSKSGKK